MSYSFGPTAAVGGAGFSTTGVVFGMARTVGVVVCAGLLAAVYQTVNDEARLALGGLRQRRQIRSERNQAMIEALVGSNLDARYQYDILNARNAYRQALRLLCDPDVMQSEKTIIRQAIFLAHNTDD